MISSERTILQDPMACGVGPSPTGARKQWTAASGFELNGPGHVLVEYSPWNWRVRQWRGLSGLSFEVEQEGWNEE